MSTLAFLQPGPFEIIVILFIVLLLFGAKRLPDLARSLGRSLQEFKRGKDEVVRELTSVQDEIDSDTPSSGRYSADIDDDMGSETEVDKDGSTDDPEPKSDEEVKKEDAG